MTTSTMSRLPDFFVPRKYKAPRSIYNKEFSKYTEFISIRYKLTEI